MTNEYLKRGKGKNVGDIKKYDFFSHYRKNAKLTKLERTQYSRFVKELLNTYSEAIVQENLELKFGKLGFIRVQARKLNFFKKDGTLHKSLEPDWPKTWAYWETKYEGLTRDEIVKLKDKKVLYFDNEHTDQEFYRHIWDNSTAVIKYKRFFKFKPSRQYSRMITEVVSKDERTVFYYG